MRYQAFQEWSEGGRWLIADQQTVTLVRRKTGQVWRGGLFAAYLYSCWLEVRNAVR